MNIEREPLNLEDHFREMGYEIYSNSKYDFMDKTSHDELMVVVLKAHMFIEQELFQLLEKVMANPKSLRAKFLLDKLLLAHGFGLIDDDIFSSLKKLNDIRNSYAHNLNFEMGEKELDSLISPLSKKSKQELLEDIDLYKEDGEPDLNMNLRITLSYLCSNVVFSSLWAIKTIKQRSIELEIEERASIVNYIIASRKSAQF